LKNIIKLNFKKEKKPKNINDTIIINADFNKYLFYFYSSKKKEYDFLIRFYSFFRNQFVDFCFFLTQKLFTFNRRLK